ncbi:hypothetical protein [Methylobacillus sp.]|uniref:hypothetical protein n=1 Tax=Methylobacillus sp. TaxID=56818 RepID=UPI00257CFB0F|nr:hypothetical protein [Methylobacillus sp.]
MSNSIDRIEAQRDMRTLSVQMHAGSGESAKKYRESLMAELGLVSTGTGERDVAGMNALKQMSKR